MMLCCVVVSRGPIVVGHFCVVAMIGVGGFRVALPTLRGTIMVVGAIGLPNLCFRLVLLGLRGCGK
ncbi:MAG: hypothetical protein RLZZ511_191 [Cyanobacteriota bacterium]